MSRCSISLPRTQLNKQQEHSSSIFWVLHQGRSKKSIKKESHVYTPEVNLHSSLAVWLSSSVLHSTQNKVFNPSTEAIKLLLHSSLAVWSLFEQNDQTQDKQNYHQQLLLPFRLLNQPPPVDDNDSGTHHDHSRIDHYF
jgi:hypothetical protein